MGDMNAKDSNQKKFTEAGFNMANGGAMGWFTTAQASITASDYRGGMNVNIDNIVTSANIRIMGVKAPKTGLNDLDHLPVIADLIITW
jgi:endonuclease/exonuclease/phosphatase family metal-dependent hydrolase